MSYWDVVSPIDGDDLTIVGLTLRPEADATPPLVQLHRSAMTGAKVAPPVDLEGVPPGVLLVTVPFRDARLLVAVNESSRSHKAIIRRPATTSAVEFDVEAGHGRMAFIDPRNWHLIDLS